MRKSISLIFSILLLSQILFSAGNFSNKEIENVRRQMKDVASYQFENPSRHRSKNRDFPMGWVPASFYTGVMAAYEVTGDGWYLDHALAWGEANHFQPGPRLRHADDHSCAQTYLDLYDIYKKPEMIKPIQAVYDSLLADPLPGREDWWWCDALFMSPPALAKLASVTGKKKYNTYLHKMFWDTVHFLFDREEGLMYRDESYFYQRTSSGKKVFWSRGNGWTMAGTVRVLEELPQKDKKRIWYENLLKTMASSIIKVQGNDGLWRASLLDAKEYPNPETSGSGFICYALAWGVNQNILSRDDYEDSIFKCWKGLTKSVHPNGKIGWVQPIGKSPDAVSYNDTQAYGAGAFLLAGSEILKMMEEN